MKSTIATEPRRPQSVTPSLPRLPYRPFVVAALPRTGSYMLTTALDDHPEIRCHGEALSPWRKNPAPETVSAAEFLRHDVYTDTVDVTVDVTVEAKAVGFKLLHQDARQGRLRDARGFLRASGVSVVHLRRRNLLRQVLSFEIARATDVWILENDEPRPVDVTLVLDPNELLRRFVIAENQRRENEQDFHGCPALEVCYEDLADDFETEMARIFRFLGVPPHPVRPTTRRQERRPLHQAIRNYDTIVRALTGTPWEAFLDENEPRHTSRLSDSVPWDRPLGVDGCHNP